jgi:nitrite reductase/ring-hydroxylating ferredoxin subunit
VAEQAPPLLQIQIAGRPKAEGWVDAGSLLGLTGATVRRVGGEDVLFARIGGSRYAYRTRCPGCASTLGDDSLEGTEFRCRSCGNRYDAIRAGRCLEQPQLQLEPLPLIDTDAGLVKVAMA